MSGFEAKVILDSIAPCGRRLTTITATYPLIVHAEVLTHRDRERNSASARAIPFMTMARKVINDAFVPIRWGSEQSGMQTGDEISEPLRPLARAIWLRARDSAVRYAKDLQNIARTAMSEASLLEYLPYLSVDEVVALKRWQGTATLGGLGKEVHKSLSNRLLSPFSWITIVMTATEWKNFFRLRCHPDAEIHFQTIACMIREALEKSNPVPPPVFLIHKENSDPVSEAWHLPFVTGYDLDNLIFDYDLYSIQQMSTARVARVSYLTHEGKRSPAKDLELFKRLADGSGYGHFSPYGHIAKAEATPVRSGPFIGWTQFRKQFANENVEG